MNADVLSIRPPHTEMIGLPTGLGLWIFMCIKSITILGGWDVRESHLLVMLFICFPSAISELLVLTSKS